MIRIALKSMFGNTCIYLRCEYGERYVFGDKKESLSFKSEEDAKLFVDELLAKKLIKKHVAKDVQYVNE